MPSRAQVYEDGENFIKPFMRWRRSFDLRLASDIDLIEWRMSDGDLVPVALLELTTIDAALAPQKYLDAIIERYTKKGVQGKLACYTARKLEVEAYIVLITNGLERFYVYCLTTPFKQGWRCWSRAQFERFLELL